VVGPDGRVKLGILSVVATTVPGPLKGCGYAVNDDHPTVEVPLPSPVFGFVDRTVRVELLLSGPSPVTVTTDTGEPVGDRRTLPRGPVAVVGLVPDGSIRGFVVGGIAPGVGACVLKATVGVPKPL
jgi:hypothetical protein